MEGNGGGMKEKDKTGKKPARNLPAERILSQHTGRPRDGDLRAALGNISQLRTYAATASQLHRR